MKKISEKTIYENPHLRFRELHFTDNEGRTITRNCLDMTREAVIIVPKDSKGNYLLCKQQRYDMNREHYEFPSGGIEEGESPIEAAVRELDEETGSQGDMEYKGYFLPLLGLVDFKVHVVYAQNIVHDIEKQRLESHEDIGIQWLERKALDEMISSGKIIDGYVLAALAYERS